jgi:type VII secretion protein EccE
MPHPVSMLGVRAGQILAWQVIALAAVVTVTQRGPGHWAAGAVTLLGGLLTIPRWRHRWAWEWLLTAVSFRRAGRPLAAGPMAGGAWPHVDVTPARPARGRAEAGVVHDGSGFAVVLALTPQPGAAPVNGLPTATLAALLDPDDDVVSAVQLITHADLTGDVAAGSSAAYRNLRYNRLPRSASAWIALRHDPAVSRYSIALAGSARDARASLARALSGRGTRLVDLVSDLRLDGELLDVHAARELLTRTLLTGEPPRPEPAADAADRWRSCHSGTRQHVTYWLQRWPAGGLDFLHQALAAVPALSVTTAVVIARAAGGRIGLTATIRVTAGSGGHGRTLGRAVTRAAASCGARLVRMDGEHAAGVLATLPLGRGPGGRWRGWHSDGQEAASPTTILPLAAGGVVLGTGEGDRLVAIPFFTAERATQITVIGDLLLPRLLALRALGSGARLQVVTAQPGGWLRLREHARVPPERMAVVRPGTRTPEDGTRADPWMIIDDTSSPDSAGSGPWQAVVTILGLASDPGAVLPGQDAIVLQRASAPMAAAAAAAVGLSGPAARSLEAIPDGVAAVARPGAAVEFAWLAPDAIERGLLSGSLRSA